MSAVDTKFYEKKKTNSFYFALIFLLLVVLATWGLFVYNISLEKKISRWEDRMAQLESSISEIESDPQIQAYRLFDRNRSLLQKRECESSVTTFITHLKRNTWKYSLSSQGFLYSDGKISTDISSSWDTSAQAYEKIVNFLWSYPEDENALFDIQPIENFDGYDRINFSTTFTLNPNLYENCSES